MNGLKQKDVFVGGEGDAWFRRNKSLLSNKAINDDDLIIKEIVKC
jgi:hypothetical protein